MVSFEGSISFDAGVDAVSLEVAMTGVGSVKPVSSATESVSSAVTVTSVASDSVFLEDLTLFRGVGPGMLMLVTGAPVETTPPEIIRKPVRIEVNSPPHDDGTGPVYTNTMYLCDRIEYPTSMPGVDIGLRAAEPPRMSFGT